MKLIWIVFAAILVVTLKSGSLKGTNENADVLGSEPNEYAFIVPDDAIVNSVAKYVSALVVHCVADTATNERMRSKSGCMAILYTCMQVPI